MKPRKPNEVKIRERTPGEKMIEALFKALDTMPLVYADRNIYKSTWEVSWPMPPRPIKETTDGQVTVSWVEYRSLVSWSDRLLDKLVEHDILHNAVLGCRVQDQVAMLEQDIREIEIAAEMATQPTGETDGTTDV